MTSHKSKFHRFSKINGKHTLQKEVPDSNVPYKVRKKKGGKLLYFNFHLAKEMGLVENDCSHYVTKELEKVVLDTFGITIVNEYDIINEKKYSDVKEHDYMATRYLQLQHPNKQGYTSGDGRSIWNGQISYNSQTWDISSCGTGATCLSPATAKNNIFYETGDPSVSYGCGRADLEDGLAAGIMSEILYRNDVKTERTLCVIEYEGKTAINVRAGKNLLRPSHFFRYLKQDNLHSLKKMVDYYISREISNGNFPKIEKDKEKYQYFGKVMAETFARTSAQFEREYIFCWLDWDGDNVMLDGGIIDYGSVRQFGLYHHEYRYDDDDRMSTNLTEQRSKARYTVQTFAQLVDYLVNGKKKSIKDFNGDNLLKIFDEKFLYYRYYFMLNKMGFTKKQSEFLLNKKKSTVEEFFNVFHYFESQKSSKGLKKVADGVNWNAIYCVRDILRELPLYIREFNEMMPSPLFLETLRSQFAMNKEVKVTPVREKRINEFQEKYLDLVKTVAKEEKIRLYFFLKDFSQRNQVINRYDRITGDAIIWVVGKFTSLRKKVSSLEFHQIIEEFISYQDLSYKRQEKLKMNKKSQKILSDLKKIVQKLRNGI